MVANMLTKRMMEEIGDASIFVFEPGMIPGYGMGSIELNLQDKTGAADKEVFYNYTLDFINKLNARPEISRAITTYARNFPQYKVEVDAAKCTRAGLSPAEVLSALGSYCGGSYISNMNQFSKVYGQDINTLKKVTRNSSALDAIYDSPGLREIFFNMMCTNASHAKETVQ